MIPQQGNGEFVAQMEKVLEVYKGLYDQFFPVVCMDYSTGKLVG